MIHVNNLPPFKRLCVTIGNLPTSFMESMTYYEALCWLVNYLKNEVIPTVNTTSEAVTELQEYVNNYFNNLDVQEEINNKLDDMAEDGTLADIIADYIELKGQLVYDTVASMKNAENLYNGSFAKTYGFYSYNDGGGALYKVRTVTNEDIPDNMFLIPLHDETLIAELIIDKLDIKQIGAYGDETHDDTEFFEAALNKVKMLFIPEGKYIINNLTIPSGKIIKGCGNAANLIVDGLTIGGSTNYNTILANLTISGESSILLNLQNCMYTILEECTFNNTTGNIEHVGIKIDANYSVNYFIKILNCVFTNFDKAIQVLNGANANTIQNNTFYNCNTCVEIDNSNSTSVINNSFQSFKNYGAIVKNTGDQTYSIGNVFEHNYIEGAGNALVCGIKLDTSTKTTSLIANRYFGLVPSYPEIINNGDFTYRVEFTDADPGNEITELPGFVRSPAKPNTWKVYNGSQVYGCIQLFNEEAKGELFVNNRVYNIGTGNYEYAWEEIPTFRNSVCDIANKQVNGGNLVPKSITMYYNKPIILGGGDTYAQGSIYYSSTYGIYSGNGSGHEYYQKISNVATVDRPASYKKGAMIFDTTLNKPIWYDGTNWIDATGTQV